MHTTQLYPVPFHASGRGASREQNLLCRRSDQSTVTVGTVPEGSGCWGESVLKYALLQLYLLCAAPSLPGSTVDVLESSFTGPGFGSPHFHTSRSGLKLTCIFSQKRTAYGQGIVLHGILLDWVLDMSFA